MLACRVIDRLHVTSRTPMLDNTLHENLAMSISQVDLNLFTVFDAIFREGGITAASKRLHLSQPAVSHALGRLRDVLGDPLFERQGNAMIPTPRARSLAGAIRSSLHGLEELLSSAVDFDPAVTKRKFAIATRESHELSLLPLFEQIARAAPGLEIATVRMERRELEGELERGELDLALDVGLPLPAAIHREKLSAEPLVVLARRDHPVVRESLDRETYLALEHVRVTGRRRGRGYEDGVLERLNLSRRVRVRCQQHAVANELVSRTDLLLTMPKKHAARVNERIANQTLAFPIEAPDFELYLYWHENVEADAANRWLRDRVRNELVP
jgi:DNA-binding transcriptional LysR family regulator